jgi:hypothetical protein
MIRDRQKEIARLSEGKPTEVSHLANLNTINYFDTTTMSYMYLLGLNEREVKKQERVDAAKNKKQMPKGKR